MGLLRASLSMPRRSKPWSQCYPVRGFHSSSPTRALAPGSFGAGSADKKHTSTSREKPLGIFDVGKNSLATTNKLAKETGTWSNLAQPSPLVSKTQDINAIRVPSNPEKPRRTTTGTRITEEAGALSDPIQRTPLVSDEEFDKLMRVLSDLQKPRRTPPENQATEETEVLSDFEKAIEAIKAPPNPAKPRGTTIETRTIEETDVLSDFEKATEAFKAPPNPAEPRGMTTETRATEGTKLVSQNTEGDSVPTPSKLTVNGTGTGTSTESGLITGPKRNVPEELHENPDLVSLGSVCFHKLLLRDACTCAKCVDPSSTQKNFQTTDIPQNIAVRSRELFANGDVAIKWENDIPGFGPDHVSFFPSDSLNPEKTLDYIAQDHSLGVPVLNKNSKVLESSTTLWSARSMRVHLEFVTYDNYMTSDATLYRALYQLQKYGLLLIRGVPESEKSVEDIAGRIGNIRDTLYGRTWNVKSVPNAKNVAYTSQYLGLHMDLLYMANPPGFQLLHCLKSTAEGGSSIFSDALHVARKTLNERERDSIAKFEIAYQYRNAGEHYYHLHPLLELKGKERKAIAFINYSPPFQAKWPLPRTKNPGEISQFLNIMKKFAENVQAPENVLEYRLQEGECVIFNNRRVLHGRKQFDALGGERWLKGTYVDTDVFASRLRVMEERFLGQKLVPPNFVFGPEAQIERDPGWRPKRKSKAKSNSTSKPSL